FLTQFLDFRPKQRGLAHCLIRLALERPEHEAHDKCQHENGNAVTLHKTVNGIEKIEQKLADNLEHTKIHDLSLVVLQLRQSMVNFRACPDLETRRVCLLWLQMKARHAHRPFDAKHVSIG